MRRRPARAFARARAPARRLSLRAPARFLSRATPRDAREGEYVETLQADSLRVRKRLEREIDVLARRQLAMQKELDAFGVDYASREADDVIAALRARLARAEAAAADAARLAQVVGSGDGALEQLEGVMEGFVQLSDASDALGADLAARADGGAPPRKGAEGAAGAAERRAAKQQLEHRLAAVDQDRARVERMMVELYTRVEKATQFVFSGQAYRSMLVWAADHERAAAGGGAPGAPFGRTGGSWPGRPPAPRRSWSAAHTSIER